MLITVMFGELLDGVFERLGIDNNGITPGERCQMNTYQLIDAALAAKDAWEQATSDAGAAVQALQDATAALKTANQALHDDLAANGPAVVVDSTITPPIVTLYTPVEPDSFAATEIRVAA
jgi:hypothetical protein